jgi:hypothetical protein
MHGFGPTFDRRSKFWYQMRSACLPFLVFCGVLLVAGYCWQYLVKIQKAPGIVAAPPSSQSGPSDQALLSANQACLASNKIAVPAPELKSTAAHQ